jgi:hypothetical protein
MAVAILIVGLPIGNQLPHSAIQLNMFLHRFNFNIF